AALRCAGETLDLDEPLVEPFVPPFFVPFALRVAAAFFAPAERDACTVAALFGSLAASARTLAISWSTVRSSRVRICSARCCAGVTAEPERPAVARRRNAAACRCLPSAPNWPPPGWPFGTRCWRGL